MTDKTTGEFTVEAGQAMGQDQVPSGHYTITLDDDPMVHKILARATGMTSIPFSTASGLLSRANRYDPMAVFIDIHLGSEESGLDIIPRIRTIWPSTAIIVITGDDREELIAQSLAAGANDFIPKPLRHTEVKARLIARIREMQIRLAVQTQQIGDISYDRQLRTVANGRSKRYLSPTESALLECLANAQGMLVTKAELKRSVWGNLKVSASALDKKIHDLRTALKDVSKTVTVKSKYGKGIQLVI